MKKNIKYYIILYKYYINIKYYIKDKSHTYRKKMIFKHYKILINFNLLQITNWKEDIINSLTRQIFRS